MEVRKNNIVDACYCSSTILNNAYVVAWLYKTVALTQILLLINIVVGKYYFKVCLFMLHLVNCEAGIHCLSKTPEGPNKELND